jgi:hypothetical protein
LAGHIEQARKKKISHRIVVENPSGKRLLGFLGRDGKIILK